MLERGGSTTSLTSLCRNPRAICVSQFRDWNIQQPPPTATLIMSGCNLSLLMEEEAGCANCCSHTNLHFPRIKGEDSVIPSKTLGVLRLKFLRVSWAVGCFRNLPLCGQGSCCYLRGNRNCDQHCDCWVFFLPCSENSRRGKMPPQNALRITDLMISPAPGMVAGTQELLHRHLLNK